jgi:RimJ/RimL family protein N-acetyltransferase
MVTDDLLKGARLRLTALRPDDLSSIARWHEDAAFMRLFDARPASPRDEATLARWLEEHQKSTEAFVFGIRPLEADTLLGYAELDGILWNHQTGWVTIGIGDPAQRGKGYGREALTLVLRFAFQEVNLHRVQLTVFAYNAPAIALYEKIGFRLEGVLREFMHRDGRRYDMYLYGLLRQEWEAREAERAALLGAITVPQEG